MNKEVLNNNQNNSYDEEKESKKKKYLILILILLMLLLSSCVGYNVYQINLMTNIDTDGDGKADLNIDLNGDGLKEKRYKCSRNHCVGSY